MPTLWIHEIGGTPDIPLFIYKPIISNDLSPLSTGEPRPRRIFLPPESRSTVYFYAGDTITMRDAASHDRTSVIDALAWAAWRAAAKSVGKGSPKTLATAEKPSPPPGWSNTWKSSGGCFVATAACGDPLAPEVILLSAFRDDVLTPSRIGRTFVRVYYAVSPPVASVIARSAALRRVSMALIVRPAVRLVQPGVFRFCRKGWRKS